MRMLSVLSDESYALEGLQPVLKLVCIIYEVHSAKLQGF